MELSESEKIWRRMALRCILFVSLAVLVFVVLPLVLPLCMPFLLAFWVAALLNPLVCQLEQRLPWKRSGIVLFILFFLAGISISFFWLVIPALIGEVVTLAGNWEPLLEETMTVLGEFGEEVRLFLKSDFLLGEEVEAGIDRLKQWISSLLSQFFVAFGDWVMKIPGFVLGLFVFFMASYFTAVDYPVYRGKMRQHTSRQWRWWAVEVKETAVQAFGGYLKAQLILTFGVGLIMILGFFCLDLPYALVLALFIALLDFIPMIGAGVVLIPWAMVAFFTNQITLSWQLGLIWLLTAGFRRLMEPKVLGQQTGLSPLLSLVSIYVGAKLGGLWGMMVAPVFCLLFLHFLAMGIFRGTMADGKACIRNLRGIFEGNEEKL